MGEFEKHVELAEKALRTASNDEHVTTVGKAMLIDRAQVEATLALAYATRGEPVVQPAEKPRSESGRDGYVFTTELGCKIEVWTQHREVDLDGRRLPGTYLRLSMKDPLPGGVRVAEVRLTYEEATNLVEALEGQF